ncbi:MAG: hypothetical protein AB7Y46_07960 [Armatimonadota bacterium]
MRWAVAVVVACAAFSSAWGMCSVREETVNGITFLVMENELICARVLPAMGGALSDLELKGAGPLLAPGRITREQVIRPIPIYREARSGWGLTDWFHPGETYSLDPWQASVVESTPAACAIQVRHRMLARTMRIYEGASAVDVTIEITNTGDQALAGSYWLQAMYALGGAADLTAGTQRLFVPIAATTRPRRGLAEVSAQPVLLADAPAGPWSRFLAPAQRWMALTDSARRLGVAVVLSADDFSDQVVFHSWAGQAGATALISQEMILAAPSPAPGASVTHRARLFPFGGLGRVDYANDAVALAVTMPEGPVGVAQVRIPVSLVSCRQRESVELELTLHSEYGEVRSETVQLADVGPSAPRDGIASFGMAPPATYWVGVSVRAADGSPIAEDALWAKQVVVR